MAQISIFFITNLLLLFIVPTETRRFCRSSHFLPSWKKYINKISNQNLKPRFSNLRPYYPYNYQNLKGSSSSSIPESALQQNTNYISQETENEVKKTEASLKRLDDPQGCSKKIQSQVPIVQKVQEKKIDISNKNKEFSTQYLSESYHSQMNKILGNYNYVKGRKNNIYGFYNKMIGNNNGVKGHENDVKGSFNGVMGNKNSVNGFFNGVIGHKNKVNGNANEVIGDINCLQGKANRVHGRRNQVQGDFNKVHGQQNVIEAFSKSW